MLHNDDTTVKILELMGKRARQAGPGRGVRRTRSGEERAPSDAACSPRASCRRARAAGSRCSSAGASTPGRTWRDVLAQRAADLGPPIQMCDALSRNLPAAFKTILANCLAHGRRQFVDVAERFPEECRYVLESLGVVYQNDALARERNLSPEERLPFHQAESGPMMEELQAWLHPAVRGPAGGAQLGAGRGHLLPAQALGEADALPASARGAAGQQHLRAGPEEGHPAPQERAVLQDPATAPTSATSS